MGEMADYILANGDELDFGYFQDPDDVQYEIHNYQKVIKESPKSWLIQMYDREFWLPKSRCKLLNGRKIEVPEWLSDRLNLQKIEKDYKQKLEDTQICQECSCEMDLIDKYIEEYTDVGFGFDQIYRIFWCPKCGTLLDKEGNWRIVNENSSRT